LFKTSDLGGVGGSARVAVECNAMPASNMPTIDPMVRFMALISTELTDLR
jgi:hypothetical protein